MSKTESFNVKKELLEIALIYVAGGCINIAIWCTDCFSDWERVTIVFTWAGFTWVFLWKGSVHLVTLLNRWVDWLKYPLRRAIVSIAGVVVLVYGSNFFLHFLYHLLVFETAYDEIIPKYSFSEAGLVLAITIGINALMHGRAFLLNWRQAAIDMEKMKTEQVSSQYQSLKNQVNPHFLFNSLNALSSLVYDDQKKAVQFIRKLSEVYRYVLDKKDEEIVPLEEELKFAKAYIFLQQIRFGENFQVEIEGKSGSAFVPPLAVQILIENAVKHNIISDDKPLTLRINIRAQDVMVQNSIQRKIVTDSTGIGLSNLKARYQYLSNAPMEIMDDGKTFTVVLPKLDMK